MMANWMVINYTIKFKGYALIALPYDGQLDGHQLYY